jgi:hypothetical protein
MKVLFRQDRFQKNTLCTIRIDNFPKLLFWGIARRNPKDPGRQEFGECLAFTRANDVIEDTASDSSPEKFSRWGSILFENEKNNTQGLCYQDNLQHLLDWFYSWDRKPTRAQREDQDIVFYSCEDGENLSHESVDEAVLEYLEGYLQDGMEPPEEVTVFGYKRETVDRRYLHPLESLLQILDDDYGDDVTIATEKMLEAEKQFLDIVISEYCPWSCIKVKEITVNSKDFFSDEMWEEWG